MPLGEDLYAMVVSKIYVDYSIENKLYVFISELNT